MVSVVKFLIFAHGNIVDGEEGASYDRYPLRKIRVKIDAIYEDLLSAICTGAEIDPATHQIKVHHRHPKSMEGRVRYSLVPIIDDDDTKDLIEMAENMGEGSIQELYIEISDRSLPLSEHKKWRVDATIPSTSQVPLSMHDPAKREIDHILEDSPTDTAVNLVIANIGNVDISPNHMIHKLHDLMASPMSPSSMSVKIMNHMDGGNQTSRVSSSTTPPTGQDYEVFLSFRGLDTRHSFTDHLYNGLINVGVWVFRDDEELRVGEMIGPELLQAIKSSRISIPIISKNYASSTWCLKELVQILECKESLGQVVLPIFYQVEPSEVRNQTGDFGNGFLECKKKPKVDGRLVQEWNNALIEVASLKGWESDKIANGHEGELVRLVVHKVLKVLRKVALPVSDHLVGVVDHVEKIVEWTTNTKGSNSVQAIVIHGIGGIGKTTLAKVVYNQLSNHFNHCSYIANVRETSLERKGKEGLQKQLISDISGEKWPHDIPNVDEGVNIISKRFNRKAVLLLLDDVDHRSQLNALAGRPGWFGSGSIIIVTSRNKDVLEKWEGVFSYEVNGLDPNQSFLLFCKHAFKSSDCIPNEYHAFAKEIVSTTQGLPLAIEVIGSLLYGKGKDIWEEKLKIWKEIPHHEVQKQLKISFDALEWDEKEIFLDIACLPIHGERELALHMWDSCGFCPRSGIEKLVSMSLLKIGEEKELLLHDLLRDLGREIVRQESMNNLGKRSRLWKKEEAQEVLELKQGTPKVQAFYLDLFSCNNLCRATSEQFESMTNLRYLRMTDVILEGDFENIFQNLKWLWWRPSTETVLSGYVVDIMRINFNPRKLVVLQLAWSNVKENWKGWSQMKYLKVLLLEHCGLTMTPDFSAMKQLEVLMLNECGVKRIHPSIGKLSKSLKVLDFSDCYELEELPIEMRKMEELKKLILNQTSIREIPISEGYMTKLEIVFAIHCPKLMSIPDSIGSLVNLQNLALCLCRLLTKIPASIGKLKLLTNLDLRGSGVTQLPNSIGDLYNLESLHMSGTPIRCLPTSIGMLSKLQVLNLWVCRKLESLLNLPCSLTSLTFYGDSMETLPDFSNLTNLKFFLYRDLRNRDLNLGNLSQLKTLQVYDSKFQFGVSDSEEIDFDMRAELLYDCPLGIHKAPENINVLLELPASLVEIKLWGCNTLRTLPNFSNLKNLFSVELKECSKLMDINGLQGVGSLTNLEIEGCRKLSKLSGIGISMMSLRLKSLDALESLPHLSTMKKLKELEISRCSNLVEIEGLNNVEGIQSLVISQCLSLERIGDLSHLKKLITLVLCNCKKLSNVQGIEKLMSLTSLSFYGCHPEIKFPDLSMLKNLENLRIKDERIMEIPGLKELKSLENLDTSGCLSLQFLPNLSQFTNLRKLDLHYCENLLDIQGLENLMSLEELNIRGCSTLQNLPDLPYVEIKSDPLEEEEENERGSHPLEEEDGSEDDSYRHEDDEEGKSDSAPSKDDA